MYRRYITWPQCLDVVGLIASEASEKKADLHDPPTFNTSCCSLVGRGQPPKTMIGGMAGLPPPSIRQLPWDVRSVQGTYFPHFRQRPILGQPRTPLKLRRSADIEEKQTE